MSYRYAPARLGLLTAAWLCAGAPASAQSLDATIADALEGQIDEQIAEQLDAAVEEAVAEGVEAAIGDSVRQQVEQQVEAGVVETIQQQVESGVVETIQQQVESGVVETIETQLESGIAATLETEIEAGVEGVLEGTAEITVDAEAQANAAQAEDDGAAASETFVAAVDVAGRAIERDVWVVLVPAEHAGRIESWGFTVRERRDLDGLGRVLLRVDAPEDRDIAQAALELALDAPGTQLDLNHVYETSQRQETGRVQWPGRGPLAAGAADMAIGLIDSAVAIDHPSLRGTAIEQRDFVPFVGARPAGHGTAVASILSRAAGKLWAAVVFFEDPSGAQIATTASLVAALDWLAAARDVRVINMSLAGPANHVLEAAIDATTAGGRLIVAAVGNNGPTGAPMYPAAYDAVIGITAVDTANRVYRHAGRGPHVSFAAPGVRVSVAADTGGLRSATGTSMAAPYAAAVLAAACAGRDVSMAGVVERLRRDAVDLGEPGYDETFGFGLIGPGPEPQSSAVNVIE